MVDVLDRDRSALGGDPPREATPDRDPHALLDLLLDALGGLGHEVAGDLVEQEERGGVRAEDRGDAIEQLAQELVHRERGQGRVADALQLPDGRLGRRQWAPAHGDDYTVAHG